MSEYRTIVADPPWNERGGGECKRGADRHYDLLKTGEIPEVMTSADCWNPADDCHLYLWATNNYLEDALWVVDELGFEYITCLTWAKPSFGLGYYFRGQTEQLLFCRFEETQQTEGTHSTLIEAPKGEDSEKPEKVYDMIEEASGGPRLEMFAREEREGWDVWGNEVESD